MNSVTSRFIDLHTHSTASDGSDSPAQLVQNALACGLSAVALCDHDTISGLKEFHEAAAGTALTAVPGVELSSKLYGKEVHIVGLFVDSGNRTMNGALEAIRTGRENRNAQILEKLRAGGYDITEEDVRSFAAGESVGRPHIARALIQKGYFKDIRDVFTKCLRRGTPFYVSRSYLSPDECIRVIQQAGGVAIWAHPLFGANSGERQFLRKFLHHLCAWKLDGIETYYSTYTENQHRLTTEAAEAFRILPSGGSDYHGQNQPTISLGTGTGSLRVPFELLEKLRSLHESRTAHPL